MVLYRPREEQRYYYGADQTEVYWVHFTGNNVKNFLRRYGIADDTRIIYTGISIEYKNLFMSMIEELNLQRIDYEEMLINYFTILLISLHRIALQKPRKKNLQNMNDMEQAAQYFRMHYNKPISIEDYAVSHNMSISWFIQNFRQYANTTPAQYVQSLRLTNAKMLLETTNYNITEIANLVGYENAPQSSKIPCKQLDIQETTKSNPYDATDYKSRNGISKGFFGNHPCKLISVHTDSPHSTILFYPGCYARRNAVYSIKQCNHSNNCQKTIYTKISTSCPAI